MNAKAIYNPRYRALVAFISDTRKRQGLTQSELGQRMRLSRQTIQKIESCEVRLDLVRYVVLCRILGLNAGPLLGRLEEPSDEDDPLYLPEALSWWPLWWPLSHPEMRPFTSWQQVKLVAIWWPLFSLNLDLSTGLALFEMWRKHLSISYLNHYQRLTKNACHAWGAKGLEFNSRRPDHFKPVFVD